MDTMKNRIIDRDIELYEASIEIALRRLRYSCPAKEPRARELLNAYTKVLNSLVELRTLIDKGV